MTDPCWRTAFASVIGTSHTKSGSPCQDTGGCRVVTASNGTEVLVAAVSDGAGTAARSEAGSALTVHRFLHDFAEAVGHDPTLASIDVAFVREWIKSINCAIADQASEEGHETRDYACTLLGAIVGTTGSVYVQIGDGAIVVSTEEPGEYSWIFWPQHGEYANTTNFITQERVVESLLFETGSAVPEIALFTDGIERLVLDLSARTVHSPSFAPIFAWLASTGPDRTDGQSPALAAYLASQHVNSRTDDDKTLVMATRVSPPASVG